jgi:hypothetical protein
MESDNKLESRIMHTTSFRFTLLIIIIIYAVAPLPAAAQQGEEATEPDSSMALKGGEEGTVLRSLTVEGEDRVRIEFERPPLVLDLDPSQAPGLDWDSTWEILGRTDIDFLAPLIAKSAYVPSPYMPRPWLEDFQVGDVVRFKPALKDVDRWRLDIVDSRSATVAFFEGKGNPPDEIGWDGRTPDGKPAPPGLTYSYVLEAYDRAGNKRNFVGKGFKLPPYRLETKDGLVLVCSGGHMASSLKQRRAKQSAPTVMILEAASRINQIRKKDHIIRIEATARSYDEAANLASIVARSLTPLLIGDPGQIQQITEVETTAPANGTVTIIVSR